MFVGLLHEFATGLWIHTAPIRFYGVKIDARACVVRLSHGGLFVYSPLALTPAWRARLDGLGPVVHVASPNKIHNLGLASFAAAYPGARIWASPGLPERRPGIRFDGVLGDAPEPAWEADLDQAATAGNVFFSEIVLLHRASRTLLVADLVENFRRAEVSGAAAFFCRLFGIFDRPLASPEHRAYTQDAEAAARVLDRVLTWDFDAIALSHGELVRKGGRDVLRRVRDHLLEEVRRRPAWRRRLYGAVARWQ